MPNPVDTVEALLVEQSLAMARLLVQCAEPVKAHQFLTYDAPQCAIESPQCRAFVRSLEKQIDQFFSDENYIERYAGYTNQQTNSIEPFLDQGLLRLYRAQRTMELVGKACRAQPDRPLYLLDIGAGDCTLDKALLEENPNLHVAISELLKVGSDATLALMALFPDRVTVEGRFDVGDRAEEAQKYDFIVCLEVIEHVTDPVLTLLNIHRSLNVGGITMVSTPNHLNWIERVLIDKFGDSNWYHHVRAYTPKLLASDAMEAGLLATIVLEPGGTLYMIAHHFDFESSGQPLQWEVTDPAQMPEALNSPPGSEVRSKFSCNDGPAVVKVYNGVLLSA